MLVAEYGQVSLPQLDIKLDPFKKFRTTTPRIELANKISAKIGQNSSGGLLSFFKDIFKELQPELKRGISLVAKSAIRATVAKYAYPESIRFMPSNKAQYNQVQRVIPINRYNQVQAGILNRYAIQQNNKRINMGTALIIGGAAFIALAILLFRR